VERVTEREWKTILCPEGKGKSLVMCEWDIELEKGRIFRRNLKQIDCCNPMLIILGGEDCNWKCEEVIAKRERDSY
jgi:hypothetical protein